MTKKITLALFSLCFLLIISHSFYRANSNGSGAPAGMSGSPGDGSSCTNCHGGTATAQSGWITSDIPTDGYAPGATYTITATATVPSITKFGFEISPQDSIGNLIGTLTIINSSETKLIGNNKYITHTSAGTTATNNSKTWSFSWTAPTQGSGDLTFYGAFLAANGNGGNSGDAVYTSTLAVGEAVTTNAIPIVEKKNTISIYPTIIESSFSIAYYKPFSGKILIALVDMQGKTIQTLLHNNRPEGYFTDYFNITHEKSGIYFIKVSFDDKNSLQRIIKI